MTDHELDDPGRSQPEPIGEAIVVHPDAGYELVLRKSFRVPQDQDYPLRVTIAGVESDVLNSSESGIQVLREHTELLQLNQVLKPVELAFMERKICVKGTVVYISSVEAGRLVFGINLFFSDEDDHREFQKYLGFIRERLLQRQQGNPKTDLP